jgi:hypothetical protein
MRHPFAIEMSASCLSACRIQARLVDYFLSLMIFCLKYSSFDLSGAMWCGDRRYEVSTTQGMHDPLLLEADFQMKSIATARY